MGWHGWGWEEFTDCLYWEEIKNYCFCGTFLIRKAIPFPARGGTSLQASLPTWAGVTHQPKASWPESQLPQPDERTGQRTGFLWFLGLHPLDIFMSVAPSVLWLGGGGCRGEGQKICTFSPNTYVVGPANQTNPDCTTQSQKAQKTQIAGSALFFPGTELGVTKHIAMRHIPIHLAKGS